MATDEGFRLEVASSFLGGFTPGCSCGWRGPKVRRESDAWWATGHHYNTAHAGMEYPLDDHPPYASDLVLWEAWGRDLYYSRHANASDEPTPWEGLEKSVRDGWCLAAHDYRYPGSALGNAVKEAQRAPTGSEVVGMISAFNQGKRNG